MLHGLPPPPETVRQVRILVIEQCVPVAEVAKMHGLSTTQVHSIVAGRSYRSAGGPIRPSKRRLRGERRVCTRCRAHKDDSEFAVKHGADRGICASCAKPEDIERAMARPNRWAARNARQQQSRAALRVQIESLSTPPWGESLLSEADRAEIEAKRIEIRRAMRVCQAPWGKTR